MRDIATIHSELRLVAALRRAARERGGPLPSIDVAGAADKSADCGHSAKGRPATAGGQGMFVGGVVVMAS